MVNIQNVTEDIIWVGASDRRLHLFENLFPLPHGISYNSYVIRDEKTVLMDTVDVSIGEQYTENVHDALQGAPLDYLVLLHMEPDHCALIREISRMYPDVTLVGNAKTFELMGQFYPDLKKLNMHEIKDGDTFSSGKHTLHFVTAPMVHWPEVMMAYDDVSGALFSADAFGTFGAVDAQIFADACDFEAQFLNDARRYYSNIVGKYGVQVQAVLKKVAGFDIRYLCSLHGPVWRKNIGYFLDKYNTWSTYTPEDESILVVYGSMYGRTASAAEAFAAFLQEKSGKGVRVYDASETHASYLISEVWRSSKIVLFCPTYNGGLYLPMEAFLHDMEVLNVQNRTFALAQNGSWAPTSARIMAEKLSKLKNVTVLDEVLTIRGALHQSDMEDVRKFVDAVAGA